MRLLKTSTLVYAHPSSVTESGTGASVQGLNVDRVDIGDGERAALKDFRTGQIATGTNALPPRRSGESGELFFERPSVLAKVHPNSGGKGAPAALMASARHETRGTELRASYPAVNENPREPASIFMGAAYDGT